MENQNNSSPPNGAVENGTTAPEVSSTTPSVEPTKRSLRVETWKKIQDSRCGIRFNAIFNRIPGFLDNEKAAALLAETDEFKKSENIKVNIDHALHAVKLLTLISGKTLYLPATRDSTALYLKVDVPLDATDEQKKDVLHVQDVQQHRTEITLENKVKFDMVVIGSVVVSRDGYRIGRGNGFTDLDIGLLIEIGSITPETLIVTMVHDVQVVDSLPTNLFQKYDTPVDLIVTPTEVIRVANRLPRPSSIFWELLSERRLKIVPVLQTLKESAEKAGKVIVLKEEDTDIEQNQNGRHRRRGQPSRRRFIRRPARAISQTDTEQKAATGEQQQKGRNPRTRRFPNNRRRRPTKSEGDQSGVEGGNKSQDRKISGAGGDRKQRQRRQRPTRPNNDFCVKLTNISRDIRVKDLKTELRKRECAPLYISWKGQFGKCYLHFGNRNGAPSTEDDINKVLQSLSDLSLTASSPNDGAAAEGDGAEQAPPQPGKQVNVELVKFNEKRDNGNGAGNSAINGETNIDVGGGVGNTSGKQKLRIKTWKKIQDKLCANNFKAIFDHIADFVGSDNAATQLLETNEFKQSENIKAYNDYGLDAVKLQALLTGKTLYLPATRDSNALYLKVDVPDDATDEEKKEVLFVQDVEQKRTEITLENKVKFDMVVIGSVLVSRDGYRIGRGNGFTDLDIGLLIEIGSITPETLIVTVVHDVQVVDSLPTNLFQKYDTPVDLIVTPTEVIRVANRLPRPDGIYWELLSERCFEIAPVLQTLKESNV